MSTTTTARKLSYRRSTVAGWEVFDFATEQVVTVVKNREQARAAIKELAALPEAEVFDAAVVMAEQSGLTADELAEVEAQADAGDGFEWDAEQAAPVVEETAKKARAKKATTPKAPKADKPKGELTVVRKLEDGQRFTLRGVGVVKVVGKVRVEKQKHLVEYEDATGAYGSTEMWANSRLRLV